MGDNRRVNAPFVNQPGSVASPLTARILAAIDAADGHLSFERFMRMALYEPGFGYYASGAPKFGHFPSQGSDFVTAPELTPLFARALARQVAQALAATGTREVWEFGAGSGALAAELIAALDAAGQPVARYTIVDLSGELRERQRERLTACGDRVRWAEALPERIEGVLLGNEVLDAMPVTPLARRGGVWHERLVVRSGEGFTWAERPTGLRPPMDVPGEHDYCTEVHPQAEAFIRTIADRLVRGVALFIDYGFPEAEYYHPQRHMGTLVAHRAHQMDDDVLERPGEKDITAHVNFTGVALAAQDAGLDVIGYTSQGRFLINLGLVELSQGADPRERSRMQMLVHEHEMGELFKVIALAPSGGGAGWTPIGFAHGDRTHRL